MEKETDLCKSVTGLFTRLQYGQGCSISVEYVKHQWMISELATSNPDFVML